MNRIGIISPNVVLNIADANAMAEDDKITWRFDLLAKRASFLFDKIFITDDLEKTYNILGSFSGDFDEDPAVVTLRFLEERGLIVTPKSLGLNSISHYVEKESSSITATLHDELLHIGNPGVEPEDKIELVGQPDVGWFAWSNGWHPRRDQMADLGLNIAQQQELYESLLLRRNLAFLNDNGFVDSSVIGRLFENQSETKNIANAWNIVIEEMPQLDVKAPWQDVLDFRSEEQTQHLSRSIRRWTRKVMSANLTAAEFEDEIRELLFEYDKHMTTSRMKASKGPIEFLVTGAAELTEGIVKLKFSQLAKFVSIMRNRKVELLEAEMKAPGRELALIPAIRNRFG